MWYNKTSDITNYFLRSQWNNFLCFVSFIDNWYNKISDITNKISWFQGSCYIQFFPVIAPFCLSFYQMDIFICNYIFLWNNSYCQFEYCVEYLCLMFTHVGINHVICQYYCLYLFFQFADFTTVFIVLNYKNTQWVENILQWHVWNIPHSYLCLYKIIIKSRFSIYVWLYFQVYDFKLCTFMWLPYVGVWWGMLARVSTYN